MKIGHYKLSQLPPDSVSLIEFLSDPTPGYQVCKSRDNEYHWKDDDLYVVRSTSTSTINGECVLLIHPLFESSQLPQPLDKSPL